MHDPLSPQAATQGARPVPIIGAAEFAELARGLIDRLEQFYASLRDQPLTCHRPPVDVVVRLTAQPAPLQPTSAREVLSEATELMLKYSLYSAHPRFLGYVCPAADPVGSLADMLAVAVNVNAASAIMAPIGHVLEETVIRWLAQLLGLPNSTGGILLSGGNESNWVSLLVAREDRAPWPVREFGFNHPDAVPMHVYATAEAHFGIEKAMRIIGLGRNALRVVDTDRHLRMDVRGLRDSIKADRARGALPICVVATLGTVATAALDPLPEIIEVAREEGLWVHVDGCYGAAAALLADPPSEFRSLPQADSISWDPHKWLRVPYEAGCLLLRDAGALSRTFGLRPSYYNAEELSDVVHSYEKGPHNSRSLSALKVWVSIKHHGKAEHAALIARDIELARGLFELAEASAELEAWSCSLSIVTFRYVPADLAQAPRSAHVSERLNAINQLILNRIQQGGDTYLSNAVVAGNCLMRACFVNHSTRVEDLQHIVELVCKIGREVTLHIAPEAPRSVRGEFELASDLRNL